MNTSDITFIITTWHSEHLIYKQIDTLPKTSEIIVVENSNNISMKKKLEATYNHVRCFVMDSNVGYGQANNHGIKNATRDYIFILNPDCSLPKGSLETMLKIIKNKDFAICAPRLDCYQDQFGQNQFIEVEDVRGFAMLLNKKKFNEQFFDENIFMYYDEDDLCKQIRQKNEKIFLLNVIVEHLGAQSFSTSKSNFVEYARNWHYLWSKFYFNRKYHGYLWAFIESFPKFIRSCVKYIWFTLKKNEFKKNVYKMRTLGLMNGYLLRPSSYRVDD